MSFKHVQPYAIDLLHQWAELERDQHSGPEPLATDLGCFMKSGQPIINAKNFYSLGLKWLILVFQDIKNLLPDVNWTNILKSQKWPLLQLPFFTSKPHGSIVYFDSQHNLFWKSNVSCWLLHFSYNKNCTDDPNACTEKKDIHLDGWCNFLHFLLFFLLMNPLILYKFGTEYFVFFVSDFLF